MQAIRNREEIEDGGNELETGGRAVFLIQTQILLQSVHKALGSQHSPPSTISALIGSNE